MRQVFLLIYSLILSCSSQRQMDATTNPPGTIQINDTLFVDQTEIANVHWREYLYYLLDINKDTFAYQNSLPDTLVWDNIKWKPDTLHNAYSQFYFRHPGFNNYPVVGISYDQAIKFCKWRTYAANQAIYIRENQIKDFKKHLSDSFPIKFYYRLPTKAEWEMFASVGIDSSAKAFKKFNKKEVFRYRSQEVIDADRTKSDNGQPYYPYSYTSNVKSYYPDKYHLYNTIGNVAEMVTEKGIAKGGSFAHPLDSCRFNIDQDYIKPESWLGFRCVAVKIK